MAIRGRRWRQSGGTAKRRAALTTAVFAAALLPSLATAQTTSAFDQAGLRGPERTELGVQPPPLTNAQIDALADAVRQTATGGRQNDRAETVGGPLRRQPEESDEAVLGIRSGRFILRPSITQRVGTERSDDADGREERVFLETQAALAIVSDWSRHQLTIDATGQIQENISGSGDTDPEGSVDGLLRLDLADETTARLRAGYDFFREDETDPNAVSDADLQATVNRFNAAAEIERAAGVIRSRTGATAERTLYGNAEAGDGTTVSVDDRDQTTIGLSSRLTVDRGSAIAPFVEAEVARAEFDRRFDRNGFERSNWTYGAQAGVEIDLGEKWSGEMALGYARREFDDDRLDAIDAVTLDGLINWSPLRGTNVQLGAFTILENSTTAGLPGSVAHTIYSRIRHEITRQLTAELGSGITFRDYRGLGIENQTVYSADAALGWSLNRHLELVADAGYTRETQSGTEDSDTLRFGIGLTLRR